MMKGYASCAAGHAAKKQLAARWRRGAAAVWMGAPAGLAQETSRTIDTCDIPIPAAASQALRDSIAALPMMRIADSAPSTAAEWEAFVQRLDGAANGTLQPLAAALGVQVDQFEVEGVSTYRVQPANVDPRHEQHRFVYVHGGAYVLGAREAGVMEAVRIASRANIQVIAIDYPMPPAHPFPAAVDDAVAVYRHVLGNRPASSIALGGSSAGGGLTLATVRQLIELGVDVPGAIYLGTPWADLTDTSDTIHTNEAVDRFLLNYDDWLSATVRLYAGDHELTHRLISPVYGDFDGFPPTYLVSGTRDMLLSDTVRVHRKLREAGVVADLNVYEGMSHEGARFAGIAAGVLRAGRVPAGAPGLTSPTVAREPPRQKRNTQFTLTMNARFSSSGDRGDSVLRCSL